MLYEERNENSYFTLVMSILVILFILFCIAMFWILYTFILYPRIKLEEFTYKLNNDKSTLETHLKLNIKNPSDRLLQVLQFQILTTSFQPVFSSFNNFNGINVDEEEEGAKEGTMAIERRIASYYYSSKGFFELDPRENRTIDMMIAIPFGSGKRNNILTELEFHCKTNPYYWVNYKVDLAGYFPQKNETLKVDKQFNYLKISCKDLFDGKEEER